MTTKIWLCRTRLGGIEFETLSGPFETEDQVDGAILSNLRGDDPVDPEEDDVFFTATIDGDTLTLDNFSGGHMDDLRAKVSA